MGDFRRGKEKSRGGTKGEIGLTGGRGGGGGGRGRRLQQQFSKKKRRKEGANSKKALLLSFLRSLLLFPLNLREEGREVGGLQQFLFLDPFLPSSFLPPPPQGYIAQLGEARREGEKLLMRKLLLAIAILNQAELANPTELVAGSALFLTKGMRESIAGSFFVTKQLYHK